MNRIARFVAIASALAFGVFASQGVSKAQVSNTWSSTGQMTQARTGAAAVLLTNGQILVSGGADGNGVPQATAEMYSPATGVFTALPAMNVPRANQAAIELATGDVLVTGGLTTGGSYSDSAEIFSASSQQWTLLSSSIGTGRAGHAMAQLSDGNVLIAGGTGANQVVGSIVLYNLSDQTFTPVATLITPRTGAVAAATPDGRVLIAGGSDVNGAVLASTEIFTYSKGTMTGTVSAGPTMTSARVGATATSTYDGVAVIGGNDGQIDLGTAEIFSQWTNTFQVVSGGTPRSGHFAAMLPNNGSILVMGGTGGTAVDLLEPWANNKLGAFFAASPSLVNQAGGFATPAAPGSLLAAGGAGSYANLAELYWFPTISTDRSDYPPGTPVVMTGAGFQPFEQVALHQHEWVDQTTEDDPDATATANSLGTFTYNGYAPDTNDIGARYHLTAVGMTSGYQAQTIFTDSITSIVFTNAPLDQAAGACGLITLAVTKTGSTYGTIDLSDGILGSGNGTFYSDSACTDAITSIAGASTVSFYYQSNTVGTDTVTVGTSIILGLCLQNCTTQTETIYAAPNKLVFLVSPGGGAPGVTWAQQPVVTVQSGNTVTPSSAPITLAISVASPAGGTLHCASNPVIASSGVAAFTSCYITTTTASSSCYQLTATSPGLTTATSSCFYITTAASPTTSTVNITAPSPCTTLSPCSTASIPDDGTTTATITVTLKDGSSNNLVGKTVTLAAGGGDSVITGNPETTNSSGQATFTVFDQHAETVIYTATDSTDGIALTTHTVSVTFVPGTATSGNSTVFANPTSVQDNGTAFSTITVTLEDSTENPVGALKNVLLKANSGTSSMINGVAGTTGATVATNASGVATFTVTDTAAQTVTYTAKDTSDNVTVTATAAVTFGALPPNLAWIANQTPPSSEVDGGTFIAGASSTTNTSGTISIAVAGGCSISGITSGSTVTMTSGTIACVVTASVTAANGYPADSISATVTATQATPTVTIDCASVTYNGQAQTPCTATVTGANGLNQPLTVTYTNNTNAGSGPTGPSASASFSGDANNTAASNSVNFTIAQLPSTVTLICPASEVYNGTAWAPCTATATGAGLDQPVTPTYSSDTTDAGTVTVNASYGGSTGNYSLGSATATFIIVPASSTVNVTCNPATEVYNGSAWTTPPCSATVTSTVGPLTTPSPLTMTFTNNVNVGTATASATYTATQNYSASANQATFNITPASSATVSISCPPSVVFNGAAQNVCSATISPVGETPNQGVTVVYTPQNTNVGQVTATATYPGDTNNATATNTTTFNITTAPVTATAGSLNAPYNGLAQSPSPCLVTSVSGFTGTVSCTNNLPTEGPAVGSGTTTPTVSVGGADSINNYTVTPVSAPWAITLALSTVTSVSCPASVTYTGSALTPACTAVVGGVGSGITQTVTWSYTNNTNAGTATATATYAGDANHAGSSGSTTFIIAPVTPLVTVSCAPGSFVYTGSALTPCTASVTPLGEGTQSLNVSYSANTNVGTATANATYAGDSNHAGASGMATFMITAATPTVTLTCPPSVVYNGALQTPCSATVTDATTLLNQTLTVTYSNNTTVGTATANTTYTNADYVTVTKSATFAIATAPVTATAGSYSNFYDGLTHSPSACAFSGAYIGALTCTNNPTSVGPAVGSGTITPVYTNNSNFTITAVNGSWSITEVSSAVVVSCPPSAIYTGAALTPCTAAVTGAGNLNQTLPASDITYTNNINVGQASVTANFPGDTNHSSSSATATFNIVLGTGTPTTTTVTCPASAPYTGSAVTPCTATVTGGGAGGLNQTLTVTYTNNTNPGTAGASASFPGNATYSASSNSTTFTIALASGTPTTTVVTCNPTSIPFTGAALTPCTATVTGAGGLNQSVPVTYTSNTNAGTATASATYPGTSTYATSTGTATFTITQVSSAVVVSCPASVAYTGAAVTPCSATVTGAGNLSQSVPVTYTNNTNVGTATANATFTGDANHTTSTNSATFQIALGSGTPTTTTVTCNPTSVAYTGAALTPCTATVTGTGLSQPLTVTYANNTNAGTATASASYPGNSTYAASNNSATFTITQVSSTVAVTCPASVAYTGSPVTPCTATATGAGNLSQSLTVTYTNNTNVGTAGASASFNGDANHTASTNSTTFQIALGTGTPTTTTIICNPTSVVYTGAAQTPCTATVTGTGLSQSLTVVYTNNTNAGTAGASASYPGDATYSPSSNSATFTITKAAATVTLSNLTQTFTGSPLPVTVTTAPTGLTVTVLYSSGSYPSSATPPSAVGSYTVTATVADPNYTGSATGTLVISSGSTGGLTFALALRSGMPEPSPYGTMVYFDLSLSGTPCPTGNVQFFVDGTASGTPVTLNGSSCSSAVTFQTATLDPGSHTVYAVYSGDTNYTGGTSNTVTHAVTADTTAVALAASATTVNVGQPVTFTVTVTPSTPQDPSAQGPEGTVTFSDGTTSIGTMTLSSSSPYTAAITTSSLAVGTHSISATFTSSDGEFTAGSSAAITVTVDSGSSGTITPTINWTNPANIVYGTPLSGTQLDATATNPTGNVTVPGTFAYTPPAGTVLPVGTVNLSVTFTPADPTTFSTQTATVTLTITPAPVTATAGSYSGTFDGNSHSPSACAVTGAFTGTLVCTDNPSSVGPAVGSGTVTPTVSGDTLANYTITAVNGSWSITQASLTPTVTTVTCNPSTLAYTGAALTPCTATVTGAGGLNQSLTVTYTNNINVGTATASASYAGSATYAASNNSATFTITQAPSTVTVTCPASVIYNSAAQTPCTATVTPAGGVSQPLTVAYTNNTNAGTASAGATYAGDASHAASSGTATFTIVKEGTTTTLTSSSSSVAPGQGVTLTAQVAPITAGTPTGTVAFYNGTTLLGTVSLTAGSATFTASSLTVGATNVLNAVYSGDSNFTTSQSSTSVVVASLDFTMTVSGPANVTVEPGGVATYQVILTPLYGNYPGPVSFTSTGLPTGATLTLNPTTIATNGGMQTVAVTVTTPAVAMQVSPPIGRKLAPLTLALLLFPLIGVGRLRRQGRRLSRITSLLLLLGCTLAGAMVTGCASGSGSGFFTQAQKTYTINVTATSGNVQHTAAVTLVVE